MATMTVPSRRSIPRRRQRPWLTVGARRFAIKTVALLAVFYLLSIAIRLFFSASSFTVKRSVGNMQLPLSSLPNPSGACPQLRQLDWNSNQRRHRFPTVDERVCYYMTRWFDPHYGSSTQQWIPKLRYQLSQDKYSMQIYFRDKLLFTMDGLGFAPPHHMKNDVPFYAFSSNTTMFSNWKDQINWALFLFYNQESSDFVKRFPKDIPVILTWGDQEMHQNVHLPVAGKWRYIDLAHQSKPAPILIPLEGGRHYTPIPKVLENDVPWHQKQNLPAVWRGDMSGIVEDGKFYYDYNYTLHPLSTCLRFPRCRMVHHYNSKREGDAKIDDGFASCAHEELRNIKGVDMMRPKLSMEEMLQHKMIISVEGNDVASGLKWNLYSKSVVLMPPPLKTIFSMELLLVPYVHYVPIDDLRNIQAAVDWVLQHDDEAERIAQRATNFIHDLFYAPESKHDNDAVLQQMADRITALWEIGAPP